MIFDEFPVTKLAPEWSENELWVKKTLPVLIYDHGTGFCELGKLDVTFPRRTGGLSEIFQKNLENPNETKCLISPRI